MSSPFSNYLNAVDPKKKKKNPWDTTDNPYANLGQNLDSTAPSMEDTFHQTTSNIGEYRGERPTGIDPRVDVPTGIVEAKRISPMSIISSGLSASTKFMDSMATKGYSVWDVITPNTVQKLAEKGPVTFIKDIGSSIGDVGSELGKIGEGVYQNITQQDIDQSKQIADFAKLPLEQYNALPLDKKNEIVTQYNTATKPAEMTTHDLLEKYHPEFVKDHPISSHVISFVGDVALDPTTYIGFESALPRIAGAKISREGIAAVRELNDLAEVGFRATIENKGLTHIVDFGPSEVRQLRYVEDTLGTAEAQKALDKYLSSYGDVKDIQVLNPVQRQQSVESTFLRLARIDPNLIQQEGLGVFAHIPVIGEVPIISSKTANKVFDTIGVTKLRDAIAENLSSKPIESVRNLFQRDFNLPKEYVEARQVLQGAKNIADHQMLAAADRFAKLSKDSRQNLTELTSSIDQRILDKTETLNKQYEGLKEPLKPHQYGGMYRVGQDTVPVQVNSLNGEIFVSAPNVNQFKVKSIDEIIPKLQEKGYERIFPLPQGKPIPAPPLSDNVINATRQSSMNQALKNGKITPEEFDMFSRFVAHQNQLAKIEMESKLYKQGVQNSVPDKGMFFTPKLRQGITQPTEEMLAKGFVPENDIAVLHALNIQTTLYKQAQEHFDNTIKLLFDTPEGLRIPKAVQHDLDYIGTSFYSKNTANMIDPLFRLYDAGLSKYKELAVPIKPSTSVKQFVGNTLAAYSVIGPRAFKSLDPRNILVAMVIMADKSAYSKFVPKVLLDGLEKYGTLEGKLMYATNRMEPQLADKISFRSRLGERIDGPQLFDELLQKDVYHRNSQVMDLDTSHNLKLDVAKANGFVEWQKEKWHQGFWTFFKESVPWINMPQFVETLNKIGTYTNARMIGHLPDGAKELTVKALFDYAHGLSSYEKSFAKRLVPFYTFQRFAIPLIASLVKNPGRAVTLDKIGKTFFEVWEDIAGGKKLTQAQQTVLPGLLIEQPHVFEGIDSTDPNNPKSDKGIFRTFNSFNFTDSLSLIKLDVNGSVDVGGTLQKMTLAQVVPVIKVPLEWAYDKNFFTEATISKGGRIATGDNALAIQRKLGNSFLPDQFEKNVPDLIKHLMSYEVKTDPVTGKQTGYINPYLTHIMSSFVPSINDYVSIGRDDLSAREFAMRLLAGVGTSKVNFEEARKGKEYEWKQKIKELQMEMRRHYMTGRSDVINDDQAKLQELIKSINKIQQLDLQK